jgi:hypothetical protein
MLAGYCIPLIKLFHAALGEGKLDLEAGPRIKNIEINEPTSVSLSCFGCSNALA